MKKLFTGNGIKFGHATHLEELQIYCGFAITNRFLQCNFCVEGVWILSPIALFIVRLRKMQATSLGNVPLQTKGLGKHKNFKEGS